MMGEHTEIAWTDATFNPWWGCQRVSPGCERCYAEAFAKRVGYSGKTDLSGAPDGQPIIWGPETPRRFFGDKHWDEPLKWNAAAAKAGRPMRVFCASMADVFEDRRDLDVWRARLCDLIHKTASLDWLLLTKRPQNVRKLWPDYALQDNVWLGATVEDQRRADERVPELLKVAARVRFLSYEPALGPVDFCLTDKAPGEPMDARIDWIIVGGESGPRARPFNLAWARETVRQCKAAGVACFVKQLGSAPYIKDPWYERVDGLPPMPGEAYRIRLRDSKGADPAEWLEDLRVRQFPEVRA